MHMMISMWAQHEFCSCARDWSWAFFDLTCDVCGGSMVGAQLEMSSMNEYSR